MKKEGGNIEIGYSGFLNTTVYGDGAIEENRFFVYEITRYPDGEVVKHRVGCLDCTELQIKRWLGLAGLDKEDRKI